MNWFLQDLYQEDYDPDLQERWDYLMSKGITDSIHTLIIGDDSGRNLPPPEPGVMVYSIRGLNLNNLLKLVKMSKAKVKKVKLVALLVGLLDRHYSTIENKTHQIIRNLAVEVRKVFPNADTAYVHLPHHRADTAILDTNRNLINTFMHRYFNHTILLNTQAEMVQFVHTKRDSYDPHTLVSVHPSLFDNPNQLSKWALRNIHQSLDIARNAYPH